jgi:hypothetical protein
VHSSGKGIYSRKLREEACRYNSRKNSTVAKVRI